MFGISGTELFIIIVFVLVVFGPDKLPQIGRTVGQFMREFKRAQESMEAIIRAEVYASENKPNPANTADVDEGAIFEGSTWDSGDGSEDPQDDTAHDEERSPDVPASDVDEPASTDLADSVAPVPETADKEDEV